MPKLSDTQAVLLSTAAQRDSGSLYPLPKQLTSNGGITKSMAALVSRGLTEERETNDTSAVSRTDGDLRYGMFVTTAGLQAIGIEPEQESGPEEQATAAKPSTPAKPERQTKAAEVLAMLHRAEGVSIAELVSATDWLPKTIRAALTGLRKKGHVVERSKRDGHTCYRIVTAAA